MQCYCHSNKGTTGTAQSNIGWYKNTIKVKLIFGVEINLWQVTFFVLLFLITKRTIIFYVGGGVSINAHHNKKVNRKTIKNQKYICDFRIYGELLFGGSRCTLQVSFFC